MAGGGGGGGRGNQQLQQWLQQFPQASSGTAAPNPQAGASPPWQMALQNLGGLGQQGAGPQSQSPAMQMMTGGMGMANQANMARPQAPMMMQRPTPQLSGPPLVQSAGGQMNPQLMQLLQQRGLMG